MDILLSGSIALDRIMVFKGHFKDVIQPEKLHVLSLSLLLDDLHETRGGVAANIAYNLALLGETPWLLGSVGKNGQEYMHDLQTLGVKIDAIHYSGQATASFSVITDLDNCQIGGFYPGAMADAETLSFAKWKEAAPLVVISPHDPQQMRHQVAECQQYGLRLVYDVGQQASNMLPADLQTGIQVAEVMIVNDYEMGIISQKTGWSPAEILAKVPVCVITLGAQGSQIFTKGTQVRVPAVACSRVIDPTGAGDGFRAGFLFGYVRQWPLEKCARLGAVVAWYTLGQTGTQAHSFTRQDIVHKYQAAYHQLIDLT